VVGGAFIMAATSTFAVLHPGPANSADDVRPSSGSQPVAAIAAPFFWDSEHYRRAGGEADRFELDDPSRMVGLSAWYHLSYVVPGDRLQVYEHNPSTTLGLDTTIGHSENVAWHVASTLVGASAGLARPGELPVWARPRTGGSDGPSAGLLFALADLDLLTPGNLAGNLVVAGTGAVGSDGSVTAVRMVDAKLAAARLVHPGVVFAPDFPDGSGLVTVIVSHQGQPTPSRTIGDWLNTAGFEAAGRAAGSHPMNTALVSVDDIRQAVAWLCGRTGRTSTCGVAHSAASVTMADTRPYELGSGVAALSDRLNHSGDRPT